jgi:hypothetical protein
MLLLVNQFRIRRYLSLNGLKSLNRNLLNLRIN